MQDTYTIGRTPDHVIREALPHKYSMELNRSDMEALLDALYVCWDHTGDERALSLRSSILSTLDIEEV